MNKIKNLEALDAVRVQLVENARLAKQQQLSILVSDRLPESEAEAYAQAFDSLLTLWQVVGTSRTHLSTPVALAHKAATLRLQPLLNGMDPDKSLAS